MNTIHISIIYERWHRKFYVGDAIILYTISLHLFSKCSVWSAFAAPQDSFAPLPEIHGTFPLLHVHLHGLFKFVRRKWKCLEDNVNTPSWWVSACHAKHVLVSSFVQKSTCASISSPSPEAPRIVCVCASVFTMDDKWITRNGTNVALKGTFWSGRYLSAIFLIRKKIPRIKFHFNRNESKFYVVFID